MTTFSGPLPKRVDLIIPQGADFRLPLVYRAMQGDALEPVDFTGWTAQMQIRDDYGTEIWIDLNEEAGITLGTDGTVVVAIDHATTEATPWNAHEDGVYDLKLTDPNDNVQPLIFGKVVVRHDVTRNG